MKKHLYPLMVFWAVLLFFRPGPALAANVEAPQNGHVKVPIAILASGVGGEQTEVDEIIQSVLSSGIAPSGNNIPFEVAIKAFEAPASSGEAGSLFERLQNEGVFAALCLARKSRAWHVPMAAAKARIPTIMLFSESVPISPERHEPSPFLFALDADESYRPKALALLASRLGEKSWVVLADHLDLKSRTAGAEATKAMSESGLDVRILFLPGKTETHMEAALYESVKDGTLGFVSFLSPLGTVKAASFLSAMTNEEVKLLYGFEPPELLNQAEGVIAIKQRMPLELNLPGGELEARATAAFRWLMEGLSSLREENLDTKTLAEAIAAVGKIPLGNGFLEISPALHRPVRKDLQILEAKDGKWVEKTGFQITRGNEGEWVVTPGKRHETSSESS